MANRKIIQSENALIMQEKKKLQSGLDYLTALTRAYAHDIPVEENSLNELLKKLNKTNHDR
jgi:hypothetical protein